MNPDLRNATYDEILQFVFDRYPEDEVDAKWYWNLAEEVQIQPRRAISFLTRLCSNAGELVGEFTLRQIAEGVNYLFGAGGRSEFGEHLWNPEIPWPERRACIRTIPNLYTQVFERDPEGIGGCAYMLWDSIAYDYHCGNRDPAKSAEDARVQDAMFEALVSMLRSDHTETLRGAVHGLGHLQHRDSNRAIRKLLSSDRDLDPALRAYAAQVLEGQFQ
jgi:hypothetical protein